MSKKRKTKKEKMRSIIRQASDTHESSPVYSIDVNSTPSHITPSTPISRVPATQYTYVMRDARQTLLITTALFAFSLFLYFLIQSHILKLPFLGY